MDSKFDDLRQRALAFLKERSVDTSQWGNDVAHLLEELSIYQIELEHQNESLMQSQHQLQEVSEQYTDLFENAPISLILVDSEGVVTKTNNTFHKVFAYTKKDVLAHRLSEFVVSAYQDLYYHFFRSMKKGISSAQLEIKMVNGYREDIFVKIEVAYLKQTKEYRLALTDITRQKKLEQKLHDETEKLRQGERRFRHLVERIEDTFFCQDLDSRHVVYISPQVKKLFGVPTEEVLRLSEDEILSYFLVDSIKETYARILTELRSLPGGKGSVEKVFKIRSRTGERRWILGSFALDQEGSRAQLLGSLHDVTTHKEQQLEQFEACRRAQVQAERLHQSFQQLKYAMELARLSSFECDINGHAIDKEGENSYWPKENGVRIPMEKWVYQEDLASVQEAWRKLFAGELKEVSLTHRSNYQGELRYFNVRISLRNPEMGKDAVAYGIIQDITEEKKLLLNLETTNNLWKTYTDSLPIVFYIKDPARDFRYILCNKAFSEFLNKDLQEVLFKKDEEIFSPKSAARFKEQDEMLMNTSELLTFRGSLYDQEGKEHFLYSLRKRFVGPDGRCLLLGASMDITEQREMKQKETENRILLQALLDHLPTSVVVKDADHDFRILLANPCFLSLVEKKAEEIYGKNDLEIQLFDKKGEVYYAEDQEVVRSGNIFRSIDEAHFSHRKHVVYEKVKIPIRLPNGRNLLLVAMNDVTQLNNLVENERLTNASLAAVAKEMGLEKSLDRMAEALQRQTECDRIVLFKYDAQKDQASLCHQWVQGGVVQFPKKDEEGEVPLWRPFIERMKRDELVLLSDTALQGEERIFKEMGTRSLVVVPVFVEDQFWGMLTAGFVTKQRVFSEVDGRNMRSFANIISLAIFRNRQIVALQKSSDEKRKILNNIRIPVWLLDGKGKLLRANTEACNMARMSEEKLKEIPCNLVYCKEETVPPWCPKMMVFKSGKACRREVKLQGKAHICHAEPILNEKGQVIEVVLSATDVSQINEKRQSLQRYLSQQEILNYSLEQILREEDQGKALGILLKLVCVYLRASRCYVLRYDFDEMKCSLRHEYCGQLNPMGEALLPPRELSMEMKWIKMFQNHNMVGVGDLQRLLENNPGLRKDMGQKFARHVKSVYAAGIYDTNKLWGSIVVVFEDQCYELKKEEEKFLQSVAHVLEILHQRFASKEKLLRALDRAQAGDKAKSYFIASVSHEIRTPLNAVIGFAELLQSFDLDKETQHDYLNSVLHSSKALLRIINDVLDLSKLQAGKMVIVKERTDFQLLCREVVNIFQLQAKEKNLELKLELEPMPVLSVDRLRLRQILFNLIGNAVKFTVQGSIRVKASLGERHAQRGILSLSVTDTGCGISQGDIQQLTLPFVQVSGMRGSHASNNGTGLGLAICQRMIEAMGGKLTIESQLGEGSCFTITMEVEFDEKPLVIEPIHVGIEGCKLNKDTTCLLVDDVPMNLKVLSASIRRFGVNILTATSGREALELLEHNRVDMVLTDLWMPGMNGEQLLRAIRELPSPSCSQIPVIAVTADVASQDNFDTKEFNSVLTKPVTVSKVLELFRR